MKLPNYTVLALAICAMLTGLAHAQSALYGGEPIHIDPLATTHRCSAGINVRRTAINGSTDRTPDTFMVTAGHCLRESEFAENDGQGVDWFDMNFGLTDSPTDFGNPYWREVGGPAGTHVDLGLIKIHDDFSPGAQPGVIFDTDYDQANRLNSPLGDGGDKIILTDIIERSDLRVGMEVCLTGATTGTNCGDITQILSDRWIEADICILSGDSGGAIYTVDRDDDGDLIGTGKAVGVLFGGTGANSGRCDDRSGNAIASFNSLSRLAELRNDEFEVLTNKVHISRVNANGFALDGGKGAGYRQNVYLWNADESNKNQQWIEIDRGDGYYAYQKTGSTFCLDGNNGGGNGQNVYLWACDRDNQNQQWSKSAGANGSYRLTKRNASGFAINGGNGGVNGQNVNLYNADVSSLNLNWSITPIDR